MTKHCGVIARNAVTKQSRESPEKGAGIPGIATVRMGAPRDDNRPGASGNDDPSQCSLLNDQPVDTLVHRHPLQPPLIPN